MTIAIADPLWLLTLAVVPILAITMLRCATTLRRVRRWVAIGMRVLLVAVLALLLARVSSVKETERVAVIAVIDASESVSRFGSAGKDDNGQAVAFPTAAETFLRQVDASRGADDLLGVVVFGGRALAVATPSSASIEGRRLEYELPGGTNIEAALRLATGLIPPDAAGRIVLMTDGNETSGDAVGSIERAVTAADGAVRIDTIPIRYAIGGETIVEAVSAPAAASEGSVVPVRVEIASTRGTKGTLRLLADGSPVDLNGEQPGLGLPITVGSGRHVVLLDVPLVDGRITRFRAVYEPDDLGESFAGDTQLDNNAAEGFTLSPGEGSILIVDNGSAGVISPSTANLVSALAGGSTEVRVLNAEALPSDLLTLQDYDLVVLNDVPADAVTEAAQRALAAHVAEVGCGLIMVGGRSSFGAGGWAGTPIEPLLPVHLDLSERLVERRTAIVFVLDQSGSMAANVGGTLRSQQAIANDAAASAAATLGSRDLVGVIAFSSGAQWVVDLAENDDPARTGEAIRAISSGGGTNLVPALLLASEALEPVEAAVKHVIVLSDGRSQNAELLPEIASEMADADINVSTISVGDGADAESMFLVAERGGGVHYAVTNPSVLPRVFVRAVRTVRDPLIKEGEIVPVVLPGSAASQVARGISGWPVLDGVVLTRFRDDPTVVNVLSTAEDEPLIAHWNAELGRVGAFTSDAAEWADSWLRWDGFRPFWAQFARAMSRAPTEQGMELTSEVIAGRLQTRLLALDKDGNTLDGLDVDAVVYAPDGTSRTVRLEQIGPGEYDAEVAADQQGTYVAVVRPSRDSARMAPIIGGATNGASLEYQALEPNTALVGRLAELGGGRVLDLTDPLGADLFDRAGIAPRRAESPLLVPLLIAAIALMLLDVAARRIAWDRYIEERQASGVHPASIQRPEASLRDRIKRDPAVAEDRLVTALSEADARAVAAEAKRQRMQARSIAAMPDEAQQTSPQAGSVVEDSTETEDQAEGGGLLAAKRRARDRFGSE